MIEKDIPGFPGLVLAFSGIEHGPMPKVDSTSPKKLANRDEFVSRLGFDAGRICQAKLVHGTGVAFVSDPEKIIEADAVITDNFKQPLVAAAADCSMVFLWAPSSQRAVSLVHSGWRGTMKSIVPKAVDFFSWRYSVKRDKISALIGPGIRECCFEVRNDENGLRNFVHWRHFISVRNGRYFVDLAGIIKEQLYRAGIQNISDCRECTYCSPKGYFSFRRDKNSLRNLAVAGFREG